LEEKRYHICYHTGAGDEEAETLEEAMKTADENAAYTQQDITIEDNAGNVLAVRHWWGVEYDEENEDAYCEAPICFGRYGYYDDWQID